VDRPVQETVVLLVDEDQPRSELLAVVLQGEGYRVEQASSVQEALHRIGRNRPALVIIDERLIHQAVHVNAELLQRWDLPMVILDPRDLSHPLVPHAQAIGSPPDIAQLLDVVAGLTGQPARSAPDSDA
jgi:DNA-binding NarL/FixJ family response regulator